MQICVQFSFQKFDCFLHTICLNYLSFLLLFLFSHFCLDFFRFPLGFCFQYYLVSFISFSFISFSLLLFYTSGGMDQYALQSFKYKILLINTTFWDFLCVLCLLHLMQTMQLCICDFNSDAISSFRKQLLLALKISQ